MSYKSKIFFGIICLIIILFIFLLCIFNHKYKPRNYGINDNESFAYNSLKSHISPDLKAPKLHPDNPVKVYVSASMFAIQDILYGVGPDGMKPGLDYSVIDFPDMICNFSDEQWKELEELCELWNVPWYGISGEIEKMGWQCYCPIRDGIPLSGILNAVQNLTYEQLISDNDESSMFTEKKMESALKEQNIQPTKENMIIYAQSKLNTALNLMIGANDLYNMYSTCNACIMNFNGIQADAGAIAELGQLGARGVPIVLLKDSVTGDFQGVINPMPVMTSSVTYLTVPNISASKSPIFGNYGALNMLKFKIDNFFESIKNKDTDIMSFCNYNHYFPIPPLQIFWTTVGSTAYFIKHRNKTIATTKEGKVDYKNDYTEFWYENMITNTNYLKVGKKLADSYWPVVNKPLWKNIFKYWY
jgi:cbb3-type cytochrome oxidase subunit 3